MLSLAIYLGLATVTAGLWIEVDREMRGLVGLARGPHLDASMAAVTRLGEASGLVPLIVLASLALWRRRRRRWALMLPAIMAGTGLLQLAAKWAADRPRPNLMPWGFPSGHVLSLVVLFGLLLYLLYAVPMRRRWRRAGTALGAATVLTVAFSRLYLDVHWFSDLAGGFVLGVAYLLFAIWLVEGLGARPLRMRRRQHASAEPDVVVPGLASDPDPAAA